MKAATVSSTPGRDRVKDRTNIFRVIGIKTCGDPSVTVAFPRSGALRTQKLKTHLLRTQSSKVFTLKPRVGQYIAIHDTLIASREKRAIGSCVGP